MSNILVMMPFKIDCSKWYMTGDVNMGRQILHGLNRKVDVVGNFSSLHCKSDSEINEFLDFYNIDNYIDIGKFASSRNYARKSFEYLKENNLLDGYELINIHNSNPALVVRINEYIVPKGCNVVFTLHSPPENSTFQFYHRDDYLSFINNPKCTLMCVSESQVNRCINALNYYKDYPDSKPNISCIVNGITTEKYDEPTVYDCGTIGRFSPSKNVLESINCVAAITRYTGGKGFYVGTGSNYEESSDSQKKYVDAIMEVLHNNPQIEWFESVDNITIKKLLASSKSYIALSTIETFGLTVCEAIMQGTPSIGFNTNGIGEIIDESVTGYTFPIKRSRWDARYQESVNLYEKCLKLDRTIVRNRAIERFNIDRVVEEYNTLYDKLTGGNN